MVIPLPIRSIGRRLPSLGQGHADARWGRSMRQ
jgi:hypothetical protein